MCRKYNLTHCHVKMGDTSKRFVSIFLLEPPGDPPRSITTLRGSYFHCRTYLLLWEEIFIIEFISCQGPIPNLFPHKEAPATNTSLHARFIPLSTTRNIWNLIMPPPPPPPSPEESLCPLCFKINDHLKEETMSTREDQYSYSSNNIPPWGVLPRGSLSRIEEIRLKNWTSRSCSPSSLLRGAVSSLRLPFVPEDLIAPQKPPLRSYFPP